MSSESSEIFEFEYNGKLYPYILLDTDDFVIRIGTISLENELLDADDIPKKMAKRLKLTTFLLSMLIMMPNCIFKKIFY